MFFIVEPNSDCYITNKIVSNRFRATDANTGFAGTLDLFKLWNESFISNEQEPSELSRILIKFDLEPLKQLTGSKLDINCQSFKANLELFNILGGQTNPRDFTISLFPLAKDFNEGIGRNLSSFSDIDTANWLTASYGIPWNEQGANARGVLGDSNVDIFVSGNLGFGNESFELTKNFKEGVENLNLDITKFISASIAGLLPNFGFRISFLESEEQDQKTRFVKRFGSRHTANKNLRPRLLVSFDDSIIDNSRNFYFDSTGSIFISNYGRTGYSNILHNDLLVTGSECLLVKIKTGSYEKIITGSQLSRGIIKVDGIYSSTFSISSDDSGSITGSYTLADAIRESGSIKFDQFWTSLDETKQFFKSQLEIKSHVQTISQFNSLPREYYFTCTNSRKSFKKNDRHRFRIFVTNLSSRRNALKLPVRIKSEIIDPVYYRIYDIQTKNVVIPFLIDNNGTRVSVDDEGLYFDIDMSGLQTNRQYGIQLLVEDYGKIETIELNTVSFRVEE
jgi:hypothetical protein